MEYNDFHLKAAAVSVVVLGATVLSYVCFFKQSRRPKTDWKTQLSATKTSTNTPNNDENVNTNDVWSERRARGVTASSAGGKHTKAGDKPFGSSYYYAHNNPSATGGYKDGLAMEDYTMNQPRLLSKGGIPANNKQDDSTVQEPSQSEGKTNSSTTTSTVNVPVIKRIRRFQWDDPGDANGIATIRIDTLPGSTLTETISWRQANIADVSVQLVDDKGLLIDVTSEEGTKYRLEIPKFYGGVAEVKKVVKPNRLLIRVYKKRSWMNPLDKSNLQAWPHP